jgi:hypothetical protein
MWQTRVSLSHAFLSFYFSIFNWCFYLWFSSSTTTSHLQSHMIHIYPCRQKWTCLYTPASCSNIHLPSSTVHPQPLLVSVISLVLFLVGLFSHFLLHSIEDFLLSSQTSFYFSQLNFVIFPNQNLWCCSSHLNCCCRHLFAVDALSSRRRSFPLPLQKPTYLPLFFESISFLLCF